MRSTFLLSCKSEDLIENKGLKFDVWDWDFIGGDDHIGHVQVPAQELVEGKGSLEEYRITPDEEIEVMEAGTLTIRCRKATKADHESLKKKENKNLFDSKFEESIPFRVTIMVEIVSAQDVLVMDETTSDPYVLVHLGEKAFHKTSKIKKT